MTEQTIFLSALDYTGPERAAYLEKACAGDLKLRRRVDELLTAHERSGEFLDEPAVAQMAAQTPPAEQNTKTFLGDSGQPHDRTALIDEPLGFLKPPTRPGSLGRLGRYEILEQIGVGGFGTVFKAFDDRLHRVVAIKVLSPAFAANGAARRRFVREAQTAAAVKNEHVVAIYDVKEESQPPYLAMELIDGISLQDKIDKTGPLGLKEILRIGMQTAEGLAAAHKQGLVHRDIKPANILLENGVERVKITDFGLARAVDDASVTQSGTVAGTPMYMSPEQAEGLAIDHRSDLFSLGTVLYAMCTGHPPFRASSTHAVLKRVIEASPRPIREINDEIPEWLCDIIARLHAKSPADRFQSAKEVADLLQQHLAHLQQPGNVPKPKPVVVPARVEPQVRAASRAVWSFAVAFGALGGLAGSVCWLIDPDRLSIIGHGSSLLLNFAYAAATGAALGILIGFVRVLFFARMAQEARDTGRTAADAGGSWRWVLVPMGGLAAYLLFLLGGYIFSDAARLYMMDMGEVRIDDFHHDEFERFVLVSDTSPEFVQGFPLPAHVPLYVDPGTYHIRAIGRHHEKVVQWEIKNSRDALGTASYQDGEECTLEIKRGQRINVSVSKWAPADAEPAGGQWVQLFNGKDLTGWKPIGTRNAWIVDGLLRVQMPGLLRTEKPYENYVFRCQFRYSRDKHPMEHLELLIHSDPEPPPTLKPDILVRLYPSGKGDVFGEGGAKCRSEVLEGKPKPRDEWRELTVTSRDGTLDFALDGEHIGKTTGCEPRRGYIGVIGEIEFRKIEIRELRASSFDPKSTVVLPDPGTLAAYTDKIGNEYYFDVTGSTVGPVWGGGGKVALHTLDSTLAAAAVHGGFLTPGQRSIVCVSIMPGHTAYQGVTKNGVTSKDRGRCPASLRINGVVHYLDAVASGRNEWAPLFNGKDLTGWKAVQKPDEKSTSAFDVVDGVLIAKGRPQGYLRTEREYQNFELKLEYRLPARLDGQGLLKGGLLWEIDEPDRVFPGGMLLELQNDSRASCYSTGPGRNPHISPLHGQGGLPSRDGWNELTLRCDENGLSAAIGGHTAISVPGFKPRRGRLALLSMGAGIHFRKIEIKELPATRLNPPGAVEKGPVPRTQPQSAPK